MSFGEKDLEYGHDRRASEKIGAPVYVDETGAVAGDSFAVGDTWYAKTQRFVGRFGVEQRGIERVPENERTDGNLVKVGTLVRLARTPPILREGWIGGNSNSRV